MMRTIGRVILHSHGVIGGNVLGECKEESGVMEVLKTVLVLSLFLFISVLAPITCHAENNFSGQDVNKKYRTKHIFFSGYEWEVKSGRYHPGKNDWLADNVWVDNEGFLHLKITRAGKHWYCAEVTSVRRFGYGSYQFQVIAPVDKLDANIVLGLFVYPGPENPDQNNELDIEFAKWGKPGQPIGNYTVTTSQKTHYFPCSLEGNYTTHQFIWTKEQILFQSFYGHVVNDATEFSRWLYNAQEYNEKITVPPVRVHMNLWLFMGKSPLDGQEQEIIIKKFIFSAIPS